MNDKAVRLSVKALRALLLTALVLDFACLATIWLWLPMINSYVFGWEYMQLGVAMGPAALRFMYVFFIWCGLACGWCLYEGSGLLHSITLSDSFTERNARRLHSIAYAFMLTSAAFIVKLILLPSLATIFGIGLFLALGLLFLVLSRLFSHAAQMKADYDLTI